MCQPHGELGNLSHVYFKFVTVVLKLRLNVSASYGELYQKSSLIVWQVYTSYMSTQ